VDVKDRIHQAAAIPPHQDHRTRTWLCKYKAIHTIKSLKDPDAQTNEKYIALCNDIEDWIDTNLGDTDDVIRRAMSAGDNDAYGRRFFQYMDSGLWKMLQENAGAQSSIFVCMVHRLIVHRLVDLYVSGMPKEITNGLKMIETQMSSSKDPWYAPSQTEGKTAADRIQIVSRSQVGVLKLCVHCWRYRSRANHESRL